MDSVRAGPFGQLFRPDNYLPVFGVITEAQWKPTSKIEARRVGQLLMEEVLITSLCSLVMAEFHVYTYRYVECAAMLIYIGQWLMMRERFLRDGTLKVRVSILDHMTSFSCAERLDCGVISSIHGGQSSMGSSAVYGEYNHKVMYVIVFEIDIQGFYRMVKNAGSYKSRKLAQAELHALNGNGKFTKRVATRARATANTRAATILFHALEVPVENGSAEALAKDHKSFNEISRLVTVDKAGAIKTLKDWAANHKGKQTHSPKQAAKVARKRIPKANAGDREHEEGLRLRDAMNYPILSAPPKAGDKGIYLAKTDNEAVHIIEEFLGHTQEEPIFLAITATSPSHYLKAVAMAYSVTPTAMQLTVHKTITHGKSKEDVPQLRDAFVWRIGGHDQHVLRLKVAAPKTTCWARGQYSNTILAISEFHDKALFTKLYKQYGESEAAFKKLRDAKDKETKRKLWPTVRMAKDEVKTCVRARIQQALGTTCTAAHLDATVNSVKVVEGDVRGKHRILRADVTLSAQVAEKLRKDSGKEGIFTDTCAYDEARKLKDREDEAWIPLKDKPCGSPWTRDEALEELNKIPGEHGGLRLNKDGVTMKLRVQKDKQEEGWKALHARKPPPSQRWLLDKVPAEIPVEAIPRILQEVLGWGVQSPNGVRRGKGANAHWRVTVKAHEPPPADIIDLDGTCVNIRKEIVFEAVPDEPMDKTDFFGDFTKESAAAKISRTPTASEGMKQFAYSVVEAKGGSYYQPLRRQTRPNFNGQESATPTPAPAALVEAVEQSVAGRGAGITAMQEAMAQMTDMMTKCAALMASLQSEREAGEPARKAANTAATAGPNSSA